MPDLTAAIALLADHLGCLQHPTEGTLNFVPLQADSPLAKTLRQHLAEAIIALLDTNGMIKTDEPATATSTITAGQIVQLICRQPQCDTLLLATNTARPLSGKQIIEHFRNLDSACPHKPLTLEVQRQRIQDALTEQDTP